MISPAARIFDLEGRDTFGSVLHLIFSQVAHSIIKFNVNCHRNSWNRMFSAIYEPGTGWFNLESGGAIFQRIGFLSFGPPSDLSSRNRSPSPPFRIASRQNTCIWIYLTKRKMKKLYKKLITLYTRVFDAYYTRNIYTHTYETEHECYMEV